MTLASTFYYGTIDIRELEQDNNEYVVTVEGDLFFKYGITYQKVNHFMYF